MKQRVLSHFHLVRQNIKQDIETKDFTWMWQIHYWYKFHQGGYTEKKPLCQTVSWSILTEITGMFHEQLEFLSANTLTLPSPYRWAFKMDPVSLKYSVLSSSWDKDLRVCTREIHPGLRLERIKQTIQSMVQ